MKSIKGSNVYKKYENMKISSKLRFINGLAFFIPMVLSAVFMLTVYFSVTSDSSHLNKSDKTVSNVSMAYEAYLSSLEKLQNEVDKDEPSYENIFPDKDKFGMLCTAVRKNGETVYEENNGAGDIAADLKRLQNNMSSGDFRIENSKIIYLVKAGVGTDSYEVIAVGTVKNITAAEHKMSEYVKGIFINGLLLLEIIFLCFFFIRVFNRSVFRRVEYSLNLLRRAIEKVGKGNLNYRIKYHRNDEFKPTCDSFNEMVDALKQSTDEIKKNEQTRKALLMSISHDIFSPLTSITAYAEGIINGIAQTDEIKLKYAVVIKNKAAEIESMVSSLLFLSKLEYGDVSVALEKLELNSFIREYVDSVSSDYALKNLTINVPENDKVTILAEKKLLWRLFNNLLDNSAKYKNKETGCVDIFLTANADSCTLIFRDDGPGASEKDIDKLFELFYRSDEARNSGNGNGIGLSIVYNIVRLHKGQVSARNAESGGLEIIIKLPAVKDDEQWEKF